MAIVTPHHLTFFIGHPFQSAGMKTSGRKGPGQPGPPVIITVAAIAPLRLSPGGMDMGINPDLADGMQSMGAALAVNR